METNPIEKVNRMAMWSGLQDAQARIEAPTFGDWTMVRCPECGSECTHSIC